MNVWVSQKQVHANSQIYHTDPQCDTLSGHGARKVDKDTIPNHDECKVCEGDTDRGTNSERTCPLCGETHGRLAAHLRGCDG